MNIKMSSGSLISLKASLYIWTIVHLNSLIEPYAT